MLVGDSVSAAGGGDGPYFFRTAGMTRGPNAALVDSDITDAAGAGLAPHVWTFDQTTVGIDLDRDGDVDGHDFITFSVCYNRSIRPVRPGCENTNADIDADGDVDGHDFITFSQCYNSSLRPPRCP